MPYQADYVLRLIEQLSGVIRAMKQRLSGGRPGASEESEEAATQAISLVLGVDPLVASRLSPNTLAMMIRLGDVHPDVLALLTEVLDIDAQALDADGRVAEAETRRAQAAAVRSAE
jgi:hypothetical protein